MEQKIRFEKPEKPELNDVKTIIPDTSEFDEPERAKAIIKNLSLSIGDTIREYDEEFTINPRMVLRGNSPKQYKKEVELLKTLCTPLMIEQMTTEIKRKPTKNSKSDKKRRDKFYNSFTKKLDKRKGLKSLKDTEAVKYFTQEDSFKNCVAGLHNCVYYLLDKERELNEFVLAWFDKPIPNTQEWQEENDGVYKVLTDSEADIEANDYLTDDEYCWKQAVENGHTTAGLEEWAEDVLNIDGRGSVLSSYNGCEEYEEVEGTDYYIYRTN